MNKVKILFLIIFVVICLQPSALFAYTPYAIKSFDVKMNIQSNGCIEVEERIKMRFYSDQHGFLYQRPVLFQKISEKNKNGQLPDRQHIVGDRFEIHLTDFQVKGQQFEIFYENDHFFADIGSLLQIADTLQEYVITYKLYDAVGFFKDYGQITWGLIPSNLNAQIDNFSLEVTFPKGFNGNESNVYITNSRSGQQTDNQYFEYKIQNDKALFTQTKKSLPTNANFYFQTQIPTKILNNSAAWLAMSKSFLVNNLETNLQLNKDGSVSVIQDFDITFLGADKKFVWNYLAFNPAAPSVRFMIQKPIFTIGKEEKSGFQVVPGIENPENYIQQISYLFAANSPARQQFRLSFTYQGLFEFDYEGKFGIFWPLYLTNNQAGILKSKTSISSQVGSFNKEKIVSSLLIQNVEINPKDLAQDAQKITIQKDSLAYQDVYWRISNLDANSFDLGNQSSEIFLNDPYFYKDYWVNISLNKDGNVHYQHDFQVVVPNNEAHDVYSPIFQIGYYWFKKDANDRQQSYDLQQPPYRLAWFNYVSFYLLKEDQGAYIHIPEYQVDNTVAQGYFAAKRDEGKRSFGFRLYGQIKKDSNGQKVYYAEIIGPKEAFIKNGGVKIQIPEGTQITGASKIRLLHFAGGGNWVNYDFPLTVKEQEITVNFPQYLDKKDRIFVELYIDAKDTNFSNFSDEFDLWLLNNPLFSFHLFIYLIVMLILFLYWLFFGRDKPLDFKEEQYPTSNVSSAELGFMYDGVLHDYDIMAALYDWHAQGVVELKHEFDTKGNLNINIKKLSEISHQATDFEKILFGGIFPIRKVGTIANIDTLQNKLWYNFIYAKNELNASIREKSLFSPGTHGFGRLLRAISFLFGATGLFFISFYLFNSLPYEEPFTYGIFGILYGLGFYGFGKIIPKHGSLGAEKYAKIRGFKLFLENAQDEDFKELLERDPNYFEKYYSYAFVFGMGDVFLQKAHALAPNSITWLDKNVSKEQLDGLSEQIKKVFNQMLKAPNKHERFRAHKTNNFKPIDRKE